MSGDDLGRAFLYLVVVGVTVAVGLAIGIIVAGRIDRIQAPRPTRAAGDDTAGDDTAGDDTAGDDTAGTSATRPTDRLEEDDRP